MGFALIGAHEVAPEILVGAGAIGGIEPSEGDRGDIARGVKLLQATGPFDVGQAVVVADNRVLAIEAAEGTDHMLQQLAALRGDGAVRWPARTGVLVKAPKPGQDRRIDLPSLGPRTVEKARAAGLAGIAVAAGETVIAEPQAVAEAADRAGLFVIGTRSGGSLTNDGRLAVGRHSHYLHRRGRAVGRSPGGSADARAEVRAPSSELHRRRRRRCSRKVCSHWFRSGNLPSSDFSIRSRICRRSIATSAVAKAAAAARPDVLVIIDSPEFTHRIAERVRKAAPSIPIVNYVSPSVWAWRPGRARTMRAYVDHVLALLPFEPAVHGGLAGRPAAMSAIR